MTNKRSPNDPPQPEPEITVEPIGSGMTAGTRTTYRGTAVRGLLEFLRRPTRGFFGDLEDNLTVFLREEGLYDEKDPTKALKALAKALKALAKEERASMRWFAAAVLSELWRVREHLAHAEDAAGKLAKRSSRINKAAAEGLRKTILIASHNAALAAYRAGTLSQEARGKFQYEETWDMGARARSVNKGKGEISGEKRRTAAEKKWGPIREEARRIADERKKKNLPHSKSDIASVLQKRLSLTDPIRTIRANI